MQETGSIAATGLYIHEAESSVAGMDKLFPNQQHEDVDEERFQPMAAAQGESRDTQTVEEAEDNLQEPDEA